MKLAVIHPSYEGSCSPFKNLESEFDPARYLPEHNWTNFRITKAAAVRQVSEIARMGFDAVVNLCDGAWDEDRAGCEVVQALEQLNVAFTGAGSTFYDPSRVAMKMACHSAGVDFPAYVVARTPDDVPRTLELLRFPMIVKHPHGYSSIGMTAESRVTGEDQLREQIARTIAAYGGALVEEFIEGREFTVLVAEPRDEREEAWVLQPVEFLFPEGESFKHFDLKWKDYEQMQTRVVAEEPLATRLREASALTFKALGGSGYGRCDLRVDAAGGVYVLEINPYCAVFYPDGQFGSADFILANDPAGHRGFLEHLLACAIRRRDRVRRPLGAPLPAVARLRPVRGLSPTRRRDRGTVRGEGARSGFPPPCRAELAGAVPPVVPPLCLACDQQPERDVERRSGGLAPDQPRLRPQHLARRPGPGGAPRHSARRGIDG